MIVPYGRGCWQDQSITLAGPAPGAPYAVMVLEKLIALGVQTVVALGWCGSLKPEVRIGDLIIPESAHSEEGTSGHYPLIEPEPQPAAGLCRIMRKLLNIGRCGFSFG